MQDMWNVPPGFRPSKSAPSSPAKPLGAVLRTRSESFHVTHKVPVGDTPYVRAKNVQVTYFVICLCVAMYKVLPCPLGLFCFVEVLKMVFFFGVLFSWWIRIRRKQFHCFGQPLMREIEWTVL